MYFSSQLRLVFLFFVALFLLNFSGCALLKQVQDSDQEQLITMAQLEEAEQTALRLKGTSDATRAGRRDQAGDPDLDAIAQELENIEVGRLEAGNPSLVATATMSPKNTKIASVKSGESVVPESPVKDSVSNSAKLSLEAPAPGVLGRAKQAAIETVSVAKKTATSAISEVTNLFKAKTAVNESSKADKSKAVIPELKDSKQMPAAVEEDAEAVLARAAEEIEAEAEAASYAASEDKRKAAEGLAAAEELAKEEVKDVEAAKARAMLGKSDLDDSDQNLEKAIRDSVEPEASANSIANANKIPVWVFLLMAAALSIAGFGLLWVSRNT